MAMFVEPDTSKLPAQTLYVGQPCSIHFMSVYYVQADGQELEKACRILNFQTNLRVYTFVGDQAKTIIANWR